MGGGDNRKIPAAMSFDEMALHKTIQYDQGEQQVMGPHEQVQVIMIRGLLKNFKQAIYYQFDQPVTREILTEVLDRLDDIGFSVEIVVSDMGSKNMALWKELNIQPGQVHFQQRDRNIRVAADVPHLLKLLRNHFIDQGFILQDGSVLQKDDVQQLLLVNNNELKVNHKLKLLHFCCKGSQRQDVKLAAQLFSRSTASAMRLLLDKKRHADFFDLINSAFDVLNSRSAQGHKEFDYAMGFQAEDRTKLLCIQQEILQRAREEIFNMRVINTKAFQERGVIEPVRNPLPFQKGFAVTIDAALELQVKMAEHYKAQFLMTSRFNQDVVENLFSRIRYLGGATNSHPGCVEFKNRLKSLILSRSSELVVNTAPVRTVDDCDKDEDVTLSQQLVLGVNKGVDTSGVVLEEPDLGAQVEVESLATTELDCTSEAAKYIAGFIAFKFKGKHPHLAEGGTMEAPISCPWIDSYSFGGLVRPSATWMSDFNRLEGEFANFHGNSVQQGTQIIRRLEQCLSKKFEDIPSDIIKYYSKMRTHIRIKFLRVQFKTSTEEQRNQKKMKHFTT